MKTRALAWIPALLLLFSISLPSCSDADPPDASAAAAAGQPAGADAGGAPQQKAAADPHAGHDHDAEGKRRERPLPAYDGFGLDGAPWSVSNFVGKRFLLFFFNPAAPEAKPAADAIKDIAAARGAHNFEVYGVAIGDADAARALLAERGLTLRTLHDPGNGMLSGLGARGRATAAFVLVDAKGYMVQASGALPGTGPDPAAPTRAVLQEWLRIPGDDGASAFAEQTRAPDFTTERLEGGEPFALASTAGRPKVLMFFLHTCPHCHEAMAFFRDALDKVPEDARPAFIGISAINKTHSVRAKLDELDLDFFDVLLDPGDVVRTKYGATLAGFPITFLVDGAGNIVSRTEGWRADREPPLMRMRLAQISGQRVPLLLHKTGYSGNEFCGVCHSQQADTWELTNHAGAFDTLVRHGEERNAECVGCHVVGWEQNGGYSLATPAATLEDVGCESCHGRGGPHLSPDFVNGHDYQAVCSSCHNPEHSLGFEYAAFLPRVSHAANLQFANLSAEEKQALLERRRKPRTDLLPTAADYVGSDACQTCHAEEHASWAAQPHAKALETLTAKGEAGNDDCLRCHTTAFGKPGAFAAGGSADAHPGFTGVGCESCHGPGGDHVGPDAPKRGTIVALRDKCDSCVILQICGSCHDDANDPGFEFEVQDKIDRQRHGTIPLDSAAEASLPHGLPTSAQVGTLEKAFADAAPDAG